MTAVDQSGRYFSPFRYPGGKGKIVNFVKLLMLQNDLVGSDYVEPYAGGASVALSLLFEDYADEIHINDINPGVHAFWDASLNANDELCRLIQQTPVTMPEWHRQRAVLTQSKTDPLRLALATFFLNRTNRSGIIRGGVIGGLKQDGPWKIDARYNKPELIGRIRKIGRHRSRIHVSRQDSAEFLRTWTTATDHPAFVYLDPPYFVKGEGLYDNFYDASDHAEIARIVERLVHPWLVSYDAAPEIVSLYRHHELRRYGLSYSATIVARGRRSWCSRRDSTCPRMRRPASHQRWSWIPELRSTGSPERDACRRVRFAAGSPTNHISDRPLTSRDVIDDLLRREITIAACGPGHHPSRTRTHFADLHIALGRYSTTSRHQTPRSQCSHEHFQQLSIRNSSFQFFTE